MSAVAMHPKGSIDWSDVGTGDDQAFSLLPLNYLPSLNVRDVVLPCQGPK